MSGRYHTIVCDPPWDVMGGPQWGGGSSRPLPYQTMTVDQIASVPVRDLVARSAHLYLWTINAYIEETYEIARLWGFKPSTLLTWTKPITGGGPWRHLPALDGMGPLLPSRCSSRPRADWPVPLRLAPPAHALAEAGGVFGHG